MDWLSMPECSPREMARGCEGKACAVRDSVGKVRNMIVQCSIVCVMLCSAV